jgi:hypothetical protein
LKVVGTKQGEEAPKTNNVVPRKEIWNRKTNVTKQGIEVTNPIIVEDPRNEALMKTGNNLTTREVGTSGAKRNLELEQINPFDVLSGKDVEQDQILQNMRDEDFQLENDVNQELQRQREQRDGDDSSQGS